MPQINGTITDDGVQKITTFTGNVTNKNQTFYFAELQDSMVLTNNGNSVITLLAGGRSYVINPNNSISVYEPLSSFNIVKRDSEVQTFTLNSFLFFSGSGEMPVIPNPEKVMIEDNLTSTNTKSGLSANQGRVLNEQLMNKVKKGELYVNVKDYDCKGDGVTDDTTGIQNAINAVKPTGGKVLIPVGRFLISSSLSIPSYVTLEGVGEKSEIFTQTNQLTLIISETNAEKVTVRNLKVSGNGTGSQPSNTIDAPNVSAAGCGIVFIGVNKGLIENCIVDNCGGNGLNGNNGIAGIYLTYGCHECIVTKNRVTNCRNGINEDNFFCQATKDAQYNIVSQNYIEGCRFGIATDCYLNAKGFQVINNVIKNCMYTAIDVNKTSQVLIKGNWIEGNGNTQQTGVYSTSINIYGNSDGSVNPQNCIVEGNMIINNYYHGIKVTNNSYYISILNNQILGGSNSQTGGNGVLVQGSRYITVKGNTIQNMLGTGVYGNPLTINSIVINVDKSVIEGNQIKGNSKHGVYFEATSFTVISNNRVDGNALEATNTYNGITLTSGSVNNVLSGNAVTGSNHKYGIGLLDSGSISNIVGENILIGNAQNLGLASNNNFLNGNVRNTANEFTLQSANGTRYKITVSDVGAISTTQVS